MSGTSRWHRPRAAFDGRYSAESLTVTLSLALALYNAIELILLILTTFKRWRGLYFWSLCVSNYGIVSYSVGLLVEYFQLAPLWVGKLLDTSGWMFMITGQSLVLYSRLNLILDNAAILKATKWMIILNAVVWYTSITILDYGSVYTTDTGFAIGFFYLEHVQMTMFCLQEFIISGLYVWRTVAFLKVTGTKHSARSVIWQLLVINLIIIAMDVVLLFLQYKHWRIYQQATKAFIYAVKLKLELNILSKLVDLVQGSSSAAQRSSRVILDDIDNAAAQPVVPAQISSKHHFHHPFRRHRPSDALPTKRDDDDDDAASGTAGEVQHIEHRPVTVDGDADALLRSPAAALRARTYSTRTTGREEDILYADMLRSIK